MARDYLAWMQSMCSFKQPVEYSASYAMKFKNEAKRRLRNLPSCKNERSVHIQYLKTKEMIVLLQGNVFEDENAMSYMHYKMAMRGLDTVLPDAVE